MASPLPEYKDVSDKNCKNDCRLQYGVSEVFENILQQQQNVKTSKPHIQPQTFSDPKDQALYSHMLNDVMLKTFDGPEEQAIFKAALEGMNKNYPEILYGEERNMFYCPTAFNFDSRIGTLETSVPDVLDKMQASLEAKKQLTKKEESNLKTIQSHLRKLRPQLAEQEFVDALACFFYKQRGIFVHSLKLDQHLKVLTDKAQLHRKHNTQLGFGFTSLENKLKEWTKIPRCL